MRMLFFIFLSLFCASCFTTKNTFPDDERVVNKQMGYSAKMLSKKYHIRPCAIGVAMPEGDIQYLELKFDIKGSLSKAEIRKLLIDMIHDFLWNINNDKELCYYLKNGCLNISEVGITLFIVNKNGSSLYAPEISIASIRKGKILYINEDPNEISIKGMKATEESYEEALQYLKNECSVMQEQL